MTFELPWPPTVNTYWRNVNGRTILSRKGREYRANALASIIEQVGHASFAINRVRVVMTAHPPDRRRRDLDNLPKAVLDALAYATVYDDDSQIDDLRIVRGPIDRSNPRLVITVEPI